MKKLVVSMFIMVTASFLFVCGVSATSQVEFSLQPGETMVVYLDNEYTFTVPDDSAGDYGFFNWTVSERPISHSGLIQSSVVNYAGASMPNITVSAQRDSTYSGNVTFMFDSAVSSGANVRIYLSVAVTLQNQTDNPISGYMNLNLSAWNYNGNSIPNMGSVNNKLNQILDALGKSSGTPDFLGDDAYVYFDKRYFSDVYVPYGSGTAGEDGIFRFSSSGGDASIGFFNKTSGDNNRIVSLFLSSGQYFFVSSISSVGFVSNIVFEGVDSSYYSITPYATFGSNGYNYTVTMVNVKHPFACNTIYFHYGNVSISNSAFYGAVVPVDDDFIAGEAVNPDQSGLINDVDNAGQQQAQQEEQLWTNINSYKGDLTFNLDDWSEAAGGLSYVSGIFMQIWNNSPTQIIILSLMLGIAMLSIGRGVQAAVRVSRRKDDD